MRRNPAFRLLVDKAATRRRPPADTALNNRLVSGSIRSAERWPSIKWVEVSEVGRAVLLLGTVRRRKGSAQAARPHPLPNRGPRLDKEHRETSAAELHRKVLPPTAHLRKVKAMERPLKVTVPHRKVTAHPPEDMLRPVPAVTALHPKVTVRPPKATDRRPVVMVVHLAGPKATALRKVDSTRAVTRLRPEAWSPPVVPRSRRCRKRAASRSSETRSW